MKIAVIEDSPQLSFQIRNILNNQKYIVKTFKDGRSAVRDIPVEEFDLCLIDINLPDMSGYEVCQKLRSSTPDMLIIFLTVRDSIDDKIKGFEAGADDYLTKPFEIPELLARIKALLKRKGGRQADIEEFGGLSINYDNQTVEYTGLTIDLSVKEFHILEYLLRNAGIIITKDTIGDLIWDNAYELSENIVAVYIGKIRKKLKKATGKQYIKTIKNKGYMIER